VERSLRNGTSLAHSLDNPALESVVEVELESFVSSLTNETLGSESKLSSAIVTYLGDSGPSFYGATVAVLNSDGAAMYSPYVYRNRTRLVATDSLMDPSYDINAQPWLTEPLLSKVPVWSEPYFDAGGGDIWMKTYSYPMVSDNETVVAVATTDLRVDGDEGSSNGSRGRHSGIVLGLMLATLCTSAMWVL